MLRTTPETQWAPDLSPRAPTSKHPELGGLSSGNVLCHSSEAGRLSSVSGQSWSLLKPVPRLSPTFWCLLGFFDVLYLVDALLQPLPLSSQGVLLLSPHTVFSLCVSVSVLKRLLVMTHVIMNWSPPS